MKERYIEIIRAMCDNDMNIRRASEALYLCRATVDYHIANIREEYGLDPKCYRDLILLEEMANKEEKDYE